MKIRSSFVSNSSSASYIINIQIDKEDFFGHLSNEYGWSLFGKDAFEEKVKRELTIEKKALKKSEKEKIDDSSTIDKVFEDQTKEHIKKLEPILEAIKPLDKYDREFIEIVLNYSHIDITKATDDEVELEYFTSMHNDFSEGMCEMLKEIVLYFMFDTTNKVKCEIKRD